MSQNTVPMTGEEILSLITEVAYDLSDNSDYQIVVVGRGTLLAFYGDVGGMTTDIDLFMLDTDRMPSELKEAVVKIAFEHGLGDDWMNDDIAQEEFNGRPDVDDLDVAELKQFFLNQDPVLFYNKNGFNVLTVFPIDKIGIWASKLLTNREKDVDAMIDIFDTYGITSIEDIHYYFESGEYVDFINYYKYNIMLGNADRILNPDGGWLE